MFIRINLIHLSNNYCIYKYITIKMKQANTITINKSGLTPTENFALEAMQIKSALRQLGIIDIWTFFKLDYPTYEVNKFRAKINGNTTDRDFVEKLRSVYEKQKA